MSHLEAMSQVNRRPTSVKSTTWRHNQLQQ